MKKLFLASFAHVTIDLARDLFPKPWDQLRIAFIPTAADPYEDKGFVDIDREALVSRGCTVVDVDLKEIQGEQLEKALSDVDAIFVAGGNTFYLLEWVCRSGFDSLIKKLIDMGVVYIGSSAGSAICCPTIEIANRFDNPAIAPSLHNFDGLNLIDFLLIPHVQKEKYKQRVDEATKEWTEKGFSVLHLTDNQAIIVNGDSLKVLEVPFL